MKVSRRRIEQAVKRILKNGRVRKPTSVHEELSKIFRLSGDSEFRSVIWDLIGRGEIMVIGDWNIKLRK